MVPLPATGHLKALQPNQAKCPRVSDSAVLLFAKTASLSQVLSYQSGTPGQSRFRRSRGGWRRSTLPAAAVTGTMLRSPGSTWLMLRLMLAAETPMSSCALWLQTVSLPVAFSLER